MDGVGAFVLFLKDQRLVMDYLYLCGTAIFFYDHLLTLHLEIKYIWLSQWSYTKILFLLIRYTALLYVIVMLHNQVFLDLSETHCKKIYPIAGYTMLAQMTLAEVVVGIRTWAVWNRRRIIGIIIVVLFIVNVVWSCIRSHAFYGSVEYGPPPYPGFRGCFITQVNAESLWSVYVVMTVFDATVLALMSISAFMLYRTGNKNELSYVIHRDGILFYVYLLLMTVTSVGLKIAAPLDLKFIMDPLLGALWPVLVCRIFINIRQAGSRGLRQHTELHTGYYDTPPALVPLQFVPNSQASRTFAQSTMMTRDTDCDDEFEA